MKSENKNKMEKGKNKKYRKIGKQKIKPIIQ